MGKGVIAAEPGNDTSLVDGDMTSVRALSELFYWA